jgi:hypothetical protein
MNIALMLLWAADGWCGTPWPHWPGPRPGPDPWPWWFRAVGVVGGVIGGWVFSAVWPAGDVNMALYAGATSIGAFVGSAIVQDIAGLAMGNKAGV